MILITGATGHAGTEISRALTQLGVKYRAMIRESSSSGPLAGANVEVVEGDFAKPETLERALDGIERALLLTGPSPEGRQYESNFIQAARRIRTPHIVKFSVYGADPHAPFSFGRRHGEAEKELEDSGIAFTMLRPNGFFQNFLSNAGTINEQNAFFAPAGDARFSTVDTRDIAAVAARVLTENGHEGKRYLITGPESLTHADIAERFSTVLGRTISFVNVSYEAARKGMLDSNLPQWLADGVLELYAFYRTGAAAQATDVVESVGKKKPTNFEQFVRDYIEVFNPGRAERGAGGRG